MNAQRSRRSFCVKLASKYEDGRTGAAYRPIRSYSNKLALRVEDRRAKDHRAPNHISKTVLSTVYVGGAVFQPQRGYVRAGDSEAL